MSSPARCPKCRAILPAPAPHPEGLPGLLYRTCPNCGTARPVAGRKPRREKLASESYAEAIDRANADLEAVEREREALEARGPAVSSHDPIRPPETESEAFAAARAAAEALEALAESSRALGLAYLDAGDLGVARRLRVLASELASAVATIRKGANRAGEARP